ncbi:MAG: lipocalin family protein [Verrucomicrobiales bacterium]
MKPFAPFALAFAAVFSACQSHPPLPRPSQFDAPRYLGEWYEVARLPVFYQPDGTLAKATYSPGGKPGSVTVFNESFDTTGRPLNSIRGTAVLEKSPPKGRFTVKFPGVPAIVAAFSGPNYHVIYVDKDYRTAVVGVPSRKALWVLSREKHLPKSKLQELILLAKSAGFDTEKLLIADWP